jgi:hypothetical protein
MKIIITESKINTRMTVFVSDERPKNFFNRTRPIGKKSRLKIKVL